MNLAGGFCSGIEGVKLLNGETKPIQLKSWKSILLGEEPTARKYLEPATDAEFRNILGSAGSNKLVVVDFTTKSCGQCNRIAAAFA